uniref:Uncharacterized protein LOC117357727 isoform X1 n=1 Tax=Geotrypetes seraphini TaxID=260995 RepID=A0A6P8QDP6_GEOSA|nr:uncharacterized protein LOC117357727 isoform X1 [Geotrypetes seraphini]XP_033794604.1 uncharacterized protein LOC117357727 isoform X1 [Geotrypetes seraphini]
MPRLEGKCWLRRVSLPLRVSASLRRNRVLRLVLKQQKKKLEQWVRSSQCRVVSRMPSCLPSRVKFPEPYRSRESMQFHLSSREEDQIKVVSGVSAANASTLALSGGTRTEFLPLLKPKVFNMETIWEAISTLQFSLGNQIQQLSQSCTAVLSENLDLKNRVSVLENKSNDCDTRIKSLEAQALTWVKDRASLHFKQEMVENSIRRSNLQIINFPKLFSISANHMFKRYLSEVLKVPDSSYPPLSKIYYLPARPRSQNPNQQNLSADSLDLTNFLERSETETQVPATLLVQFAIDSDRE